MCRLYNTSVLLAIVGLFASNQDYEIFRTQDLISQGVIELFRNGQQSRVEEMMNLLYQITEYPDKIQCPAEPFVYIQNVKWLADPDCCLRFLLSLGIIGRTGFVDLLLCRTNEGSNPALL